MVQVAPSSSCFRETPGVRLPGCLMTRMGTRLGEIQSSSQQLRGRSVFYLSLFLKDMPSMRHILSKFQRFIRVMRSIHRAWQSTCCSHAALSRPCLALVDRRWSHFLHRRTPRRKRQAYFRKIIIILDQNFTFAQMKLYILGTKVGSYLGALRLPWGGKNNLVATNLNKQRRDQSRCRSQRPGRRKHRLKGSLVLPKYSNFEL
jgi:hypothetical protein